MPGAGRPKKTRYQIPRGMHDLLSEDLKYFQKIVDTCDRIASYYRFGRIETPILEQAELFTKGVGQSTDIIEKQMYALKTEGEDVLALRPEYTASVVRAFIEKGMEVLSKPVKLWYFGPCFRHEKPQAGRYREFWQFGFEALGERNPVIDAQIIRLFLNILEELKLKNLVVQINSIGDPKCRAHYKKVLTRFLKSSQAGLCSDCKKRLKQNPLRALDCKNEKCQAIISQAPQILDYLCKECRAHFKEVLEFLDALKIPYRLNPYLVRGLDYYTKTVFEISCGNPSSELNQPLLSLVGGGRYDGLVKLLGGKDTPACGAAAGIERIVELMKEKEIKLKEEDLPKVFLVQLGNLARSEALILFEEFRKAKIPVYEAFSKDSLRAQLARADRFGVKYVLILGQKEVLEKKVILRDMKNGNQRTFRMGEIVEAVKTELKK
jgi:histidyl-tRNA synthetase